MLSDSDDDDASAQNALFSSSVEPPSSPSAKRTVLLIDMDCFYAAVEMKRLGVSPEQPLVVLQW